MKQSNLVMLAVAVAGVYFLKQKMAGAGAHPDLKQALLSTLSDQQVTLSNGNILDTGTGIIWDKATGTYMNVYTGQVVYHA